MKLTITFKTPDAGEDEIEELVRREVDRQLTKSDTDPDSVDEEDKREMGKVLKEQIKKKLKKWIEYSEYVRIEFDLDNGEAKVLPN